MLINQDFINGINANSPQTKIRMTIDDEILNSDDHIKSASFEFSARSFIGEFPSWKCTVTLHYEAKPDYRNKDVYVEVASVFNGVSTFIPMGYFKVDVDGQETDEINKEVTLTMFDAAFHKFRGTYIPTVSYPCTGLDIVLDICDQAGVQLDIDQAMNLDEFIFAEPLNMPSDVSLREMIMHYAAANLAIAYINREGNLSLKCVFDERSPALSLASTHDFLSAFTHDELSEFSHDEIFELGIDKTIYTIDDYSFNSLKLENLIGPVNSLNLSRSTDGDEIPFDEVIADDPESILEYGLNQIKIDNNYFTDNVRELIVQGLFDLSKGFTYVPYDIDIFARPDVDPGDLFILKNSQNIEFKMPIVNIYHEFNGGMMSSLNLNVIEQAKERYTPNGLAKNLSRVSIKADKVNAQVLLLAEEVNVLDAKLQSTEAILEPQSFRIKVRQADIDNYGNVLEEVSKNFVFDNQGLEIGTSNSSKSMKVDEESIKFMDGSSTLASLSGEDGLDVSRARITQSIKVGVHKIEKYDDETTIVRFIGVN